MSIGIPQFQSLGLEVRYLYARTLPGWDTLFQIAWNFFGEIDLL